MMQNSRLILAILFALLPFACSSDEETNKSADGGAGAGQGGRGGHGGSAGSSGTAGNGGAAGSTSVTCGGTACTLSVTAGFEQLKACCTDAGGCGLKMPNIAKCLPANMPGTPSADCPLPTFAIPGGNVLPGCCGPSGCGALDSVLGCIPNSEIGAPAAACTYDPTNDCTALTGVTCDGAEDCPSGQRCCAKLQGGSSYVEFGCFDSCTALADGGVSFVWKELCHAGDTCEGTGFNCLTSTILPPPIARCDNNPVGTDPSATSDKSANHVACGSNVCGAGEKCCVRSPHAPYCAKESEPCECHPLTDGGTLSSDAAADSAPSGRDASRD
jgi:hypothetical protein